MSKVILEQDHSQQHQLIDNVYLSSQIKQMNIKLDANLASQQNTMEIVGNLSLAIADMQEKMDEMEQLLNSAIDNQEVII